MEVATRPEIAEDRTAELVQAVRRVQEATVDAITPTRALHMVPNPLVHDGEGNVMDRVVLTANVGDGVRGLRVLRGAHEQIAEKTGIPWKYYERMLGGQPDLLALNVNRWFHEEPKNRLLRMLKPLTEEEERTCAEFETDLQVRGFLGERFKPIDNGPLIDTLLPELEKRGAYVTDWNLDDKRFHLRAVTPEQDIKAVAEAVKVRNPEVGAHFTGLNEIVQFGVMIRNSETGHASYSAAPLVKVLRCVNLLVVTEKYRLIHVGSKRDETMHFQEDTRRLDDAATFLKIRDHVIEIFSRETVEKVAVQIAEAQGATIALPTDVPTMRFIGAVGAKYDLTERETEILGEEFLTEIGREGGIISARAPSRWALSQALTATARVVREEAGFRGEEFDYDRRIQLEEAGWKILTDPVKALIQEASTN